ncbi:lytic transglycosylase domain-containing protein [Pseudoalteromonas denitrificans]|uniref:Transglycosylase SLT domain-containing protein n=1 Tax=Pseudoalteromonas denitrificans DSM 6059 TaxID=1123010 RepID=A0A1I1SAJ3_9GAMM|nr:lytic transglycosylase domain-containing protein [Pseudoalteromonas denitrificans]SFD43466.1 Transglycosylase SLT domain-containing protein [Pseudoalteromonas denitrificans DSM 6059]
MIHIYKVMIFSFAYLLCSLNVQASYQSNKLKIMNIIIEKSIEHDLDPVLALSVAKVESNFEGDALSHAGARGVMQIMPATALGEFNTSAEQLYDIPTNIEIGIKYLKKLMHAYNERLEIALSHYNGGSAVKQYDGSLQVIPATSGYVRKVISTSKSFRSHRLVNKLIKKHTQNYFAKKSNESYLLDDDEEYKYLSEIELKKLSQIRKIRRHNLTRNKHHRKTEKTFDVKVQREVPEDISMLTRKKNVRQWESIYQADGQLTR